MVSVQNNTRVLMAKKRVDSVKELMKETGLSRNALNKLWHDKDIESVTLGTLVKVCNALDVTLAELIEYDPTQNDRES